MAKLYFYHAAMNAGKSAILLQSNYNYIERGMDTILFSPSFDTRFGKGKITSRIGLQAEAVCINEDIDLFNYTKEMKDKLNNLACVLVDELHFLNKENVEALARIVDELDIPVLAYGLRVNYKGEPFESSLYMLLWADELIEIKTICHCGKKAIMNMLIDESGKKVVAGPSFVLGGNESYVSVCRKHFKEGCAGFHKFKNKENAEKLKRYKLEMHKYAKHELEKPIIEDAH